MKRNVGVHTYRFFLSDDAMKLDHVDMFKLSHDDSLLKEPDLVLLV